MNKIIAFALILFMFISGCGPKFMPVAVSGAKIDEKNRSITIGKEGISIKASVSYFTRTPYDLESYLVPFNMRVRNETGKEINIAYENFILLDDKGNQYRPYPPEKISEIIKSDPEYAVKPPTVAISLPNMANYTSPAFAPPYPYGYDYYPYGEPYFDASVGHWVYPPSYYDRYRRDQTGETLMQDIYLDALPMGGIVDGAQVSGDLYFKADTQFMNSLKVRVSINGVIIELPFNVK
ncbi:MAG: hypothetical protein OEV42_06715 [Deltaproteobacteria bacterium]|nr:hypothetical protein [Deltaproteobacteria bacterium]